MGQTRLVRLNLIFGKFAPKHRFCLLCPNAFFTWWIRTYIFFEETFHLALRGTFFCFIISTRTMTWWRWQSKPGSSFLSFISTHLSLFSFGSTFQITTKPVSWHHCSHLSSSAASLTDRKYAVMCGTREKIHLLPFLDRIFPPPRLFDFPPRVKQLYLIWRDFSLIFDNIQVSIFKKNNLKQ